ncbi:Gfo/Idh/MocA family protein [Erysipelothrix urinaevulpis]|uniref:Gfo/Idh/MocA family protein n=1 Tax=Erysipelothrix urinaevulpis TaxID=2683717 RepID=UPI00135B3A8A|nr:Gfo/Idh/MocA family oxidoreductase [Erysipelothrix urinaevulpis]
MLKVALLGCGTMGKTHVQGYKKMDDVDVVAVCDIREEFAQFAADELNSKVYLDFDEMMANESFDMIDICLPTYMHHDYAIAAMKQGKAVFCEKPIALSLEDAKEMIDTAKEENVKFSVGHVLRFFPTYAKAAEKFTNDNLGQARLIRTVRNQGFPMWSWNDWFSDYSLSGGPYVDLMIHDLDWIVHSFGKVERVYARSHIGDKQDQSIAILRLENGAIVHAESSWAYPQGSPFKMSFEIVGTQGQLEYDNQLDASITLQTRPDDQFNQSSYSPDASLQEPYYAELRSFVDHVAYDAELFVTPSQAYESLKVALAAKKSAETQKAVIIEKEF